MPPIGRFKPPTSGELGVIFVLLLAVLLGLGGLLLYLSFGQLWRHWPSQWHPSVP